MVDAVDAVYAHLGAERLMGGIVFGNDEKAARVLVNAVDDARADGPADARQLPRAVVKQRVDERAVRVAGGRVHDHALRLVDNEQVVVLVHNVQRDVLGPGLDGLRVRQVDGVDFAGRHLILFVDGRAAAGHKPLLDQILQRTAGQRRALPGQPGVQTSAVAGGCGKLKPLHLRPPLALRSYPF